MTIRVMASRHSAFYSPLLCTVKFLRQEGCDAPYSVLAPGQRTHALIRDGVVDVMQSAVSSNWSARERGIEPLPVHFAHINRRDGFFLTAREPYAGFEWKKLEGATLLADRGEQPLVMLKYAIGHNGVDWKKIKVARAGPADYGHYQAPIPADAGEVIASVGAAMPPVAFSSLCCARSYQQTEDYRVLRKTFERAKEWVRTAPPEEVAAAEAEFFPDVPAAALADAVRRYQAIGSWDGGTDIPPDLYEQALNVFAAFGEITWRHPYDEVVG